MHSTVSLGVFLSVMMCNIFYPSDTKNLTVKSCRSSNDARNTHFLKKLRVIAVSNYSDGHIYDVRDINTSDDEGTVFKTE